MLQGSFEPAMPQANADVLSTILKALPFSFEGSVLCAAKKRSLKRKGKHTSLFVYIKSQPLAMP